MKSIKQEFNNIINKKFKDMIDVLFQRYEVGILNNENRVSFTDEEIDRSIEFDMSCYKENFDSPKFKEAFRGKNKASVL